MATTISPLYALHIAVVAVAFVDTVVAVVENRLQLNLVMQADAEKLPVMVAVVTVRMVAEGVSLLAVVIVLREYWRRQRCFCGNDHETTVGRVALITEVVRMEMMGLGDVDKGSHACGHDPDDDDEDDDEDQEGEGACGCLQELGELCINILQNAASLLP